MPRREVDFRAGNYYHLYNRGVNKQPIFFEAENYLFFLRRLRQHFTPGYADIVAYCLMPNHYHLLVYLKQDELARLMHAFSMSYAKAVNERYQRVGPLFQSRFQAKWVDREAYLLHMSRYLHLNPVRAGLVTAAAAWPFSSYLEYIGLRQGTLPRPEVILAQFASNQTPGVFQKPGVSDKFDRATAQHAYRQFVETYQAQADQTIEHLLFDEK